MLSSLIVMEAVDPSGDQLFWRDAEGPPKISLHN